MKSASKIGSSTSFNAAWTTRSAIVGIPSAAHFPPVWGSHAPAPATEETARLQLGTQIVQEPERPCARRDAPPSAVDPGGSRPCLPATRSNATNSVAGSCTKLNRSSNRRPDIPRPTVKLGLDPQYPPLRHDEACQVVGIHRRNLLAFQSFPLTAAALRHVRGFPALGLLRRLRPTRTDQRSTRPAAGPDARQEGDRDGSRVHCIRSTRRSPTRSLRHHHDYPAALHRGLPADRRRPTRSSPPSRGAHRSRPISTRFRAGPRLRDVNAGSSRTPFHHCSPDPHHLAVLACPGFVRAAPTLPGVTRIRLPPASPAAATGRWRRSLTSTRIR